MEDTIKLPLDADGVPIRPGDVVYHTMIKDPSPKKVWALRYTGTRVRPWSIEVAGETIPCVPYCFSHAKPDTWDDIEVGIRRLANCYFTPKEVNEEAALMIERIKRMVER